MRPLRHALRVLLRAPLVNLIAVLSLALGIGATTAIFSLFDQMLLRPLPVPEPGQLVDLSAPGPKSGWVSSNNAGSSDAVFSHPMFRDLQREQKVLTGLAAHRLFGANLAWRGQTESSQGLFVSGSYFDVLELQPALGRLLNAADDDASGAHLVAVLGHEYWRTHLGASPDVLGRTLRVNGHALEIVGVAPAGFQGTTLGSTPRVFVPLRLRETLLQWKGLDDRHVYWAYLFGRLAPGVSLERAEAALNVPYHAVLNDVEAPLQKGMSDQTLARFRAKRLVLSDGSRGQSSVRADARTPLSLLLGVAGFVLLIACANVANLLLARGASRSGEIAVRLSIGANRRQLVGQLLAESSLLAALGGVAGLFVADWTLSAIVAMLPTNGATSLSTSLDVQMLAFAAALSLGTGLAFGLFPALEITRPDLASSLRGEDGRTAGSRTAARFRWGLATAQIALSMTLLVVAGLFTKSLANVVRTDLGIATDHLLTFGVSPELNGYSPEQSRAFFARLEDALKALPGVTHVAASQVPLISGSNWGSSVSVEGFDAAPDTDAHSSYDMVGPDYFATLGIPLLAGRGFRASDGPGAPKVAVINEAFARKFGLGRDAVGKHMSTSRGANAKLDIEIVGVVPDAKYSEVKKAPPPQFFRPYRQDDEIGALSFYVRSARPPEAVMAEVPGVVTRLDPNLPVEELRTMDAQVRENIAVDGIISTLSASFALLATLLAAVGLYGVLAYTVSRRTRELGVRMALGADAGRLRRLVLAQVGRMTLVGGAIGLAAAIGLGRLVQSLLYQMQGYDPAVLLGAAVALAAVALLAGLVPAQRAARVDPMRALRYE